MGKPYERRQCPACGAMVSRLCAHLQAHAGDPAHVELVASQRRLMDRLFEDRVSCTEDELARRGILLTPRQVREYWKAHRPAEEVRAYTKAVTGQAIAVAKRGKTWTPAQRRAREAANARGAYVNPWNKGLTVDDDPRVRANQDARNAAVGKVLRAKYAAGEMVPWMAGHTAADDPRIAAAAAKTSATMKGRPTGHPRGAAGVRRDLGFFCASSWEANVFRLLLHLGGVDGVDFLREDRNVFPLILPDGRRWLYHVDLLDVTGLLGQGPNTYFEIKGYADERSVQAVRLFQEQYPKVRLRTVTVPNEHGLPVDVDYRQLCAEFGDVVPLWETRTRNLRTHPELYAAAPVERG